MCIMCMVVFIDVQVLCMQLYNADWAGRVLSHRLCDMCSTSLVLDISCVEPPLVRLMLHSVCAGSAMC